MRNCSINTSLTVYGSVVSHFISGPLSSRNISTSFQIMMNSPVFATIPYANENENINDPHYLPIAVEIHRWPMAFHNERPVMWKAFQDQGVIVDLQLQTRLTDPQGHYIRPCYIVWLVSHIQIQRIFRSCYKFVDHSSNINRTKSYIQNNRSLQVITNKMTSSPIWDTSRVV